MAKITKYQDAAGNRTVYISDRHHVAVSPNPVRAVFTELELTQRIEENIPFFWSNKGFHWFNEITEQIKSLVSAERTKVKIQKYSTAKYCLGLFRHVCPSVIS
jgi:hypothetical protein